MFDSDKTEKATPRRRQQAREKGQVAKSQDLTTAIMLLISFLLLTSVGRDLAESIFHFARSLYSQNEMILGGESFLGEQQISQIPFFLAKTIFYFLGKVVFFVSIIIMTGVGVQLSQSGWMFLPDKILPNWGNLSPLKGLGRIFSFEGFFRVGIGLLKIVFCLLTVLWTLLGQKETILTISQFDSWNIFLILVDLLYRIGWRVALVLLALSVFDFFYQRWKLENDLKMTPQEIREEMRETIGDPQIIAQRKQRQLRRSER